ncbi:MAG: hypothetical protein ACLRZH_05650 [Ruthenibacterium lactatiformans]
MDIYAPDMQKPHRLEFWGDEVTASTALTLFPAAGRGGEKIYLSRPGSAVRRHRGRRKAAAPALSRQSPPMRKLWPAPWTATSRRWTRVRCPPPWTNIWRCGTKSRRRSLNISTRPSCSSTSQAPCARPPKAWSSASERRSRACWKRVCWPPGWTVSTRTPRICCTRRRSGMPWCVKILPAPSRT